MTTHVQNMLSDGVDVSCVNHVCRCTCAEGQMLLAIAQVLSWNVPIVQHVTRSYLNRCTTELESDQEGQRLPVVR